MRSKKASQEENVYERKEDKMTQKKTKEIKKTGMRRKKNGISKVIWKMKAQDKWKKERRNDKKKDNNIQCDKNTKTKDLYLWQEKKRQK